MIVIEKKQVKLTLNGITKRFSMPDKFECFKNNCKMAFNLNEDEITLYNISYIDDEDDQVIISNQFDYDQAILFTQNSSIQYLRVNLEQKENDLKLSVNLGESQFLYNNQDVNDSNEAHTDPMRHGLSIDRTTLIKKVDEQTRVNEERKKFFEKVKTNVDLCKKLENFIKKKEINDEEMKKKMMKDVLGILKRNRDQHHEIKENPMQSQPAHAKETEKEKEIDFPIKASINPSEEFEKERRKVNIMERIRKKAYEDLLRKQLLQDKKMESIQEHLNPIPSNNKLIDEKLIISAEVDIIQDNPVDAIIDNQFIIVEKIADNTGTISNSDQVIVVDDKNIENFYILTDIVQDECKNVDKLEVEEEMEAEAEEEVEKEVEVEEKLNKEAKESFNVKPNLDNKFPSERESHLESDHEKNIQLNKLSDVPENYLLEELNNSITSTIENQLTKSLIKKISNKAIEKSNEIILKYLENIRQKEQELTELLERKDQDYEKIVKELNNLKESREPKAELVNENLNQSIHDDIRCDGCNSKPIIGDRYKCAICKNFDFCEKCEYKNAVNLEHPHCFIRIRKTELSPEYIKNKEINVVKEIEDIKVIEDIKEEKHNMSLIPIENSQIFRGSDNYSSICLTENLVMNIKLTKDFNFGNVRTLIKLKNTGTVSWPKPSFLACIKEKSTLLCPTAPISAKISANDEINVEVKIDLPDDIKSGKYFICLRLYHSSSKNYFGDEICLVINVEERNYLEEFKTLHSNQKEYFIRQVYQMRNDYGISPEMIKDEVLIIALVKNEGNIENAICHIFES